jgi:hypothetical protein
VCTVRDPAKLHKCAEALAGYNRTPLRKVERNGRTFHILPTKPATGYTFDGAVMHYSNTFEVIEEMLALKKTGGRTLADSEVFTKLRARLPANNVLLWAADMQWASKFSVTALAWAKPLRRAVSIPALDRWLQPLQEAGPGLSLGLALRNEPDAFVLHVESLAADLWHMLPGVATVFKEPGGEVQPR